MMGAKCFCNFSMLQYTVCNLFQLNSNLFFVCLQDHDGSHIKGLLINLFHSFWPSLLKAPSFLLEFITPIVKVLRRIYWWYTTVCGSLSTYFCVLLFQARHRDGRRKEAFYTMPQYEIWKENLGSEAKNWTIKYYKVCWPQGWTWAANKIQLCMLF